MNIVIAGAGTVGYSLAQTLSFKHNVAVIDQEGKKLEKIAEALDIYPLKGDAEDPGAYRNLPFEKIDLFVAVTDSDEVNLLSTLVAEDCLQIARKIVRLKNENFLHSHVIEKLQIDHTVFPDLSTVNKIKELFRFPRANNVKSFHQTSHKLISVRVEAGAEHLGRVEDYRDALHYLVGIERNKHFFVPNDTEPIREGDLLYFFGQSDTVREVMDRLAHSLPDTIRKTVIFGTDTLARKIAKAIVQKGIEVKMIGRDAKQCRKASEALGGKVRVVHNLDTSGKIYETEGLQHVDMAIAASKSDTDNIVTCIEASEQGIVKTVAINNDKSYYDLMHKMGIVVVRGSKAGAHYAILENIASSSIITQRRFCGGRGILFMRKIYPGSTLIGRRIRLPKAEDFVALLLRESKMAPLQEQSILQEGDIIVLFAPTTTEDRLQQWIYAL